MTATRLHGVLLTHRFHMASKVGTQCADYTRLLYPIITCIGRRCLNYIMTTADSNNRNAPV